MQTQNMYTRKIHPGTAFPQINATLSSGEQISLNTTRDGCDWKVVVVYRGKHCPICTKYLNQLEGFKQQFLDEGVDLIAVSGDSKSQLNAHLEELNISFPVAYGLTEQDMQTLGLFISEPRSEQETDHNFAEPALFVINGDNQVHIAEIANAPFIRPDIELLLNGLRFIRDPDNNYPIRGQLSY